ncbi:MAG: DUF4215 domain-containing protein [Candidatus Peribacteraceae bacterium]|nr:DUF4215 domain-containing protein [Candidatus Peribacteraceae bacterium]
MKPVPLRAATLVVALVMTAVLAVTFGGKLNVSPVLRGDVGTCGNSVPDPGEPCDNSVPGGGHIQCNVGSSQQTKWCGNDCQCHRNTCGDGMIWGGERCEWGVNTCGSNGACYDCACHVCYSNGMPLPGVGNGCCSCSYTNQRGWEVMCQLTCAGSVSTLTTCGDGHVTGSEICDTGSANGRAYCTTGAYCENNCTECNAHCGDGMVGPGEVCDSDGVYNWGCPAGWKCDCESCTAPSSDSSVFSSSSESSSSSSYDLPSSSSSTFSSQQSSAMSCSLSCTDTDGRNHSLGGGAEAFDTACNVRVCIDRCDDPWTGVECYCSGTNVYEERFSCPGDCYGGVCDPHGSASSRSSSRSSVSPPCNNDSECNDGNICTYDICEIAQSCDIWHNCHDILPGHCNFNPITPCYGNSSSVSSVSGCTDSDGGLIYSVWGSASGRGQTINDICSDSRTIVEAYCNGTTPSYFVTACPSGQCVGGVCYGSASSSSQGTCTDSDGGANYFVWGSAHGEWAGGSQTNVDYCLDGRTIMEAICSGERPSYTSTPCPSFGQCLGGICYVFSSSFSSAFSPSSSSSSSSSVSPCGNGTVNQGEQCDDANAASGDGCSVTCSVEKGWKCSGQTSICLSTCGDLIVVGSEQCDDGQTPPINGDGCSAACRVEEGWTCDVNRVPACRPSCGDGLVTGYEQCDDRNQRGGDGCSSLCTIEPGYACTGIPSVCRLSCGNGIVDVGEQCDDRNMIDRDGCSSLCQTEPGYACSSSPSVCRPTCGNGKREQGEECDDSNTRGNDGCDSSCHIENGYACSSVPSKCTSVCGDGLLTGNEQCDDENKTNGDGCSSTCRLEAGYSCTGVPSTCSPVCGNGIVTYPAEPCDDHNTNSYDGCSGVCTKERGWVCTGSPSLCTPVCGDGVRAGEEECDDGNHIDHDGCNHFCKFDTIVVSSFSASSIASSITPLCGNGRLDNSEQCEQDVRDCPEGYACDSSFCLCVATAIASSRPVSSRPSSASYVASFCGDRTLNPGEECESGMPCPSGFFCSASCRCIDRSVSFTTSSSSSLSSEKFSSLLSSYSYQSSPSSRSFQYSSTPVSCGNGILEMGEQCDRSVPCPDGGLCDMNCLCQYLYPSSSSLSESGFIPEESLCGNGLIEGSEECDDGNSSLGDGCSPFCEYESGYACAGEPSRCSSVCGDGIRTLSEQCDDENVRDGDGCSSVCETEYAAAPSSIAFSAAPPSIVCGNGILETGEQCDDGNFYDNDGCSHLCELELLPAASSFALSAADESVPSLYPVSSSAPLPVPVSSVTSSPGSGSWFWAFLASIAVLIVLMVLLLRRKSE